MMDLLYERQERNEKAALTELGNTSKAKNSLATSNSRKASQL